MIIRVKNLKISTIIGAYQIEKQTPQIIYVNLTIDYDEQIAKTSDKMEDAMNYHPLCDNIVKLLKENQFQLLERAVNAVGEYILSFSPRIRSVTVEIDKPQAPIQGLESVSVAETFAR